MLFQVSKLDEDAQIKKSNISTTVTSPEPE